ncbi:hypothetical protein [Legionella sp. WA2022007384]
MAGFFGWTWGEKKFDQVTNALKSFDKPDIYGTIGKLMIEIKQEKGKSKHSHDIREALVQLEAKLDEAREKFDNETNKKMTVLQFGLVCRNFAEECRSALYKYEPTLMAAPGWGNKFKAYFKAFLEEYFGLVTDFEVTKSTLGLEKNFRDPFNKAKTDLMPPQDDCEDPCSCMPGF